LRDEGGRRKPEGGGPAASPRLLRGAERGSWRPESGNLRPEDGAPASRRPTEAKAEDGGRRAESRGLRAEGGSAVAPWRYGGTRGRVGVRASSRPTGGKDPTSRRGSMGWGQPRDRGCYGGVRSGAPGGRSLPWGCYGAGGGTDGGVGAPRGGGCGCSKRSSKPSPLPSGASVGVTLSWMSPTLMVPLAPGRMVRLG